MSTTSSSRQSWWEAGKRSLPDGARVQLELVDERRFGNGTVYLRYVAI